ncbi:MAG: SIMPL domain-containing protein [Anaerolinea sp.]|nr:SIMPL domain-containing protein [Anaerolinea sp.]
MSINRSQFVAGVLIAVLAIAALGVFVLGPSTHAAAQAQPAAAAAPSLPRTITVVGEGTVAVQPDVAQVQIGVEIKGDNAQEASAEAAATMDAILAALAQAGVAAKEIQTTGYNIWVEQRVGPDGAATDQVIYHVGNSVSVTVRDLEKVGDVLDAAIAAGANSIYGVNFSVDDTDEVMAEARRLAAADALARAQELAGLHGVALGEVVSVSEVIDGMAVPVYESVNASMGLSSAAGPISPGELKMSARLQVVYAIAGPAAAASAPVAAPDSGVSASETGAALALPAQPVTTTTTSPLVEPTPLVEQMEIVKAAPAGPGQVTIRGDDRALRPFLDRWFSSMYRGMGLETTLTLGGLPDELPFDLIAPAGTSVLYSLERNQGMGTQLALHTPLSAPDALDYLAARLAEQGYAEAKPAPSRRGVFGESPEGVTFCSADGQWGVTMNALSVESGSDVDIFVQTAENTLCGWENQGSMADRLLPHLTLPAGVQPRFSAMSGGGDERSVYASSMLTADLSPAELAAHYSQQLEAAGWEQTSASQTDAVDWSVWQFSDQAGRPWTGTLLVAARPAQENALLVLVQIERQP